MQDNFVTTDGRRVELDDSVIRANTARRLAELERSDSAHASITARGHQDIEPVGSPTGSVNQGGSKVTWLDSGWTDAAVIVAVGLAAVATAAVAPPIALGLAAAAASLAVDVMTHRAANDNRGVLRRPGSLIKAAVAGAAVAIAPVTTIAGVLTAAAAVTIAELMISDEPDQSGNLLNGSMARKVGNVLGIDLGSVTFPVVLLVVAGLLLGGRYLSGRGRSTDGFVKQAYTKPSSLSEQTKAAAQAIKSRISKLTVW